MKWHLRDINGLRKHGSTGPNSQMNPSLTKNASQDGSRVDMAMNVEGNQENQAYIPVDTQKFLPKNIMESDTKYCIALCTDFVAPKFGGVETHSY